VRGGQQGHGRPGSHCLRRFPSGHDRERPGAAFVGQEGAAKRIDGLAIALWNRMTVEDMSGLDLSYAPPFSPVWGPVLIAARKAAELIERPS
jgi:hypothetical protein